MARPAPAFEWDVGKHGCSGTCAPPSDFRSLLGWSDVYLDPAFPDSGVGCNIQVQGFRTYVHVAGRGWIKVQDQNLTGGGLTGAHYVDDYSADAHIPWNERAQPDGSVLIDSPPKGFNDQFWPTPRPTYAAGTLDGFFDEALIRVDAPDCHLIAQLGGDWWRSANATLVAGNANNPSVGAGNWAKLTTDYRYVYFTTFTEAMLQAEPPPLTPPTSE